MLKLSLTYTKIYLAICLIGLLLGITWSTKLFNSYEEEITAMANELPAIEKETVVVTKIARVTAYSCGGLTTQAEIEMNCPS
jgi:hypothetical protein